VLLELGPIATADMERWTRFARRVLLEVRTDTERDVLLDLDVLDGWSRLIDSWQRTAATSGATFRWAEQLDCAQGEYLLHGLVRGFGADDLGGLITLDDLAEQTTVTRHVLGCFLDAMCDENDAAAAFTEDLRARFLSEAI